MSKSVIAEFRRVTKGVRKALLWSGIGLAGAQATIAAALVALDAVQRRKRSRRAGFPHPGTFQESVAGSRVTVFTDGQSLYDSMLEAISRAERYVFFQSYIWKNDATGRAFKDALSRAADRGVDVYVSYDVFANLLISPKFFRFQPAIHVLRSPFFRPGLIFANIRSTGLDHRKLLVIDDNVGYVGGYNVGSLYATEWRDTHMKIAGPSTWELRDAFTLFWNMTKHRNLPEIPEKPAGFWEPRLRAAANAPVRLVYPIRGMYLTAINRASTQIYLTTAYLIPDGQLLDSLTTAARRGVDVRILVPEKSNHVVSDWLSRGFYSELLRAGVKILLYQHAMVHAKTATIDGEWTTIGTANIDRLSLTGNYEINMEIYDRSIAADMEKIFAVDSGNSHEVTEAEWRSRGIMARLAERILAPLRPIL